MRSIRGGEYPDRLDAILYEDRAELTRARIAEDNRLLAVVDKYDDAALATLHCYKTLSGMPQSEVLSDILLHLFNHQAHHRGQAHACLHTSPQEPLVSEIISAGQAVELARLRSFLEALS